MTAPAAANVVQLLQQAARAQPDRRALAAGESVTFAQLWDRVDRCSVGLRRCGLQPGDRAICMIPMSVDLYVVLLGLLKAGAVAVFVDPWIGLRQIAAFSAFAEPRAFLGVPKSHVLRLLDGGLRRLPITVTTGRCWGGWPARASLADLLKEPGDGHIHVARPDDSALITFTSGSSGTPKGANRTHAFLLAQHDALKAEFPVRPADVDMTMFPVFALNNLAQGLTTIIPDMDFRHVAGVDAARLLAQMERHGVTTCTASPPFFDRLAGPRSRIPMRRILTGGAPVSEAQLDRWRAAWPDTEIVVVYGSTEAEPVAHATAGERRAAVSTMHPHAPGFCTGHPSARVRTRIIRIEKGPVALPAGGWSALEQPAGQIGELVVAGAHVCRDYFRNPAAVTENKITEPDGTVWHRMGDTGYLDEQGRFWLVGRVHSTIVRADAMVHPQLVEQAAAGPGIRQVAAVGLPDAALGERVVLVVAADGAALDRAALRGRLESANLAIDELVVMAGPLPVDPRHNVKIDYAALRQRLLKKT
jgi:acyl-CoA synthetase (AMP-forming)/AMP-acid ligase II